MKLYTEEQVREAIRLTHSSNRRYLDWLEDDIVNALSPIELPSDEEIEDRIGFEYPATYQNAFKEGAKWMRDKISGGNK